MPRAALGFLIRHAPGFALGLAAGLAVGLGLLVAVIDDAEAREDALRRRLVAA